MSAKNMSDLANQAELMLEAGRIGEARTLYERITRLDPDNADAWFMLGVICGDTGQAERGIHCLQRALQLNDRAADTHLQLGNLLLQRGDIDAAVRQIRQATVLDPQCPEAWLLLGNVLGKTGSHSEAIHCQQQAVRVCPDSVEARLGLARSLRAAGQHDDAASQLRSLVQEQPENPEALAALGDTLQLMRKSMEAELVYRQLALLAPRDIRGHNGIAESCLSQRKLQESEQSCIAALKLDANNVQALANLGTILQAKGNLDGAHALLQQAVSLAPDDASVHYKFACIALARGDAEQAKHHCRRAIVLKPDFVEGHAALASIHEQEGKFDQAWDIIQKLVSGGNRNPHILFTYADLAHRYDKLPTAIRLLEGLVADEHLSRVTRSQSFHQLAELYNRSGDYDRAFLSQRMSNRLKEASFEPQAHADRISTYIRVFDRNLLASGPCAVNRSELPVFIIGMPRSGTTLVEQILASHLQVHGAGELLDIINIASGLGNNADPETGYPMCLQDIPANRLDEIADRYLEKLRSLDTQSARITDKMPHNFLHLGLIQMLFPAARIIHTVRNPLDTCVSVYFQEFSSYHSYAYDLHHLAAYYREYERLMKHWEQVIKLPILKVPYEQLVNDQEGWSRRLIEFIGLDWDEQCLRFFENRRLVATPSYDQVRQPLYNHSVERWRRYETHLGPLKQAFCANN